MSPHRRLFAAAAGAATVAGSARVLAATASPRWQRSNYAGRPVDLRAGPALVSGVTAGCLVAGAPRAAAAAAGAGAFGLYDDIAGSASARGLRGHLDRLRRGELTTGAVKLAGLVGVGLAVSPPRATAPAYQRVLDAGLVAGAANVVNLLDLRPGRALKAALVGAAGLVTITPAATGIAGAAAATLPADLAERVMIGDCGANGIGAALGALVAVHGSVKVRATVFAGLVGITLASERVSLSAVIARQPVLAAADRWGRRCD